MKEKFEIKDWDDIKDEYYKIMLTPSLVRSLGLNLVFENDVWWIEVNKDKISQKNTKLKGGKN